MGRTTTDDRSMAAIALALAVTNIVTLTMLIKARKQSDENKMLAQTWFSTAFGSPPDEGPKRSTRSG